MNPAVSVAMAVWGRLLSIIDYHHTIVLGGSLLFLENALKVAIVCCTSICSCPVPRSRSNSIFNSPSNVLKMKLCLD